MSSSSCLVRVRTKLDACLALPWSFRRVRVLCHERKQRPDCCAILLLIHTEIRIFIVYLIKSVWIKNERFFAVIGAYCCLSVTINVYLAIAMWNRRVMQPSMSPIEIFIRRLLRIW